jgi:hypothetical protein
MNTQKSFGFNFRRYIIRFRVNLLGQTPVYIAFVNKNERRNQ